MIEIKKENFYYRGPGINEDLIRTLRRMAIEGTTVPELIATIRRQLEVEDDSLLQLILYFQLAFMISIASCKEYIGHWMGAGGSIYDDEAINNALMPLIKDKQGEWEMDTRCFL